MAAVWRKVLAEFIPGEPISFGDICEGAAGIDPQQVTVALGKLKREGKVKCIRPPARGRPSIWLLVDKDSDDDDDGPEGEGGPPLAARQQIELEKHWPMPVRVPDGVVRRVKGV